MIPIQLLGVLIGIAASHLTHLYYRRAYFSKRELLGWLAIWCAFVGVAIFPNSVSPIVGYLGLQRPMDLIMIIAFIILFVLGFYNYMMCRRQAGQLERLVRDLALRPIIDPQNR